EPLKVFPSTLAMHWLSGHCGHPLRHFRARPHTSIFGWMLQCCAQSLLLRVGKQGGRWSSLTSINESIRSFRAITLHNLLDGAYAIASGRANFTWRLSQGYEHKHLPAPSLSRSGCCCFTLSETG